MDIFFVVSTLVVVILGILGAIALFYLIRILRNVEHVSLRVAEESDNLQSDIATLREKVREEGLRMKHFSEFFGTIFGRTTRKRAVRKTDTNN